MTHMKHIGCVTRGVDALLAERPGLLFKLLRAFGKASSRKEDWFYSLKVDGHRFFAADNGEDGYTVMLPEEY